MRPSALRPPLPSAPGARRRAPARRGVSRAPRAPAQGGEIPTLHPERGIPYNPRPEMGRPCEGAAQQPRGGLPRGCAPPGGPGGLRRVMGACRGCRAWRGLRAQGGLEEVEVLEEQGCRALGAQGSWGCRDRDAPWLLGVQGSRCLWFLGVPGPELLGVQGPGCTMAPGGVRTGVHRSSWGCRDRDASRLLRAQGSGRPVPRGPEQRRADGRRGGARGRRSRLLAPPAGSAEKGRTARTRPEQAAGSRFPGPTRPGPARPERRRGPARA